MSTSKAPFHFVCTLAEAGAIIARHKKFWISNCGCREQRKSRCRRSPIDVCLYFNDTFGSSGTAFRRSSSRKALAILALARRNKLVARPYPNPARKEPLDGICFCCDDCCDYFLHPRSRCAKGKYIEHTDRKQCTACGACVKVCYFDARFMKRTRLLLHRARCFGCGLCVDVCRAGAISMILRR